jgi:tetratricopeptide (TPR) repeat protein
VTEKDAPAVAELCARLEGIPLALELAAARMRSLSVDEINARLHDRFKLLTGGSRIALERQQTLRALVSWSYDLLQPNEQILLDRLSIFAGGFDLAAAEAVCGADPIMPEDVVDLVTSLVEKSLVMFRQDDGRSRYGMLETIREFAHKHFAKRYELLGTIKEFASERLKDRDDVPATAARHCDYYLGVAKTARPKLEGPEQAEWMRRLEVDLDNLRAAIALALAGRVDPVIAVKFEVALIRFRILRGYLTEGRNNIRAALELSAMREPNLARGHALYVGGTLAANQSDHAEATRLLTECLAIRQGLGDLLEVAGTLSTLGVVHLQVGKSAKARECEEQCLAIFRQLGNRIGEALALGHLGEISMQLGEDGDAREKFEQCLAIAQSIGHHELEAECERYLGELALDAGDLRAARERLAGSLKVCRDAEDKRNEAIALWCLGKVDAANGDFDSARKKLADALRAFETFQMSAEALDCLEDHAGLLRAAGRCKDAVPLLAATAVIRERLAISRPKRGEAKRQSSVEAARAALGADAFDAGWAVGCAWALDDAIEHALALVAAAPVTA